MPILSIITATHNRRWKYYEDAADSVFSQQLPVGWDLEWIIQVDGITEEVHETLEKLRDRDSRIQLEQNHAQLGPGGTRSLSIMRAKGELFRVVDSDDILLPDTLAPQIQLFIDNPSIHWSTYQPIELMMDGEKVPDPPRIDHGLVKAGELNVAMQRIGRCPVHCAALMLRSDTVRAFGGWLGLPVGEDVPMLAAISEMYDGWIMEEYGWLYRKHEGQITHTLLDKSWETMGEDSSRQRITAMKNLGWEFPQPNS